MTKDSAYRLFDPTDDCDKTPTLIRDATKDAGIDIRTVCYISDRAKFASKAGEAFARDLDRVGKMVRVVVPFGHLLLVNGTEPAVQMAVRFYDYENERRTNAARFAADQDFGGHARVAQRAARAIQALRSAYTSELVPYKRAMDRITPRIESRKRTMRE